MLRLALLCVLLLFSGTPVFAFENIEVDKLYDTTIKEQIEEEFTQASKMLKAQADALGMPVREKDVDALRQHMYEKAILIGSCFDKAITFYKTVTEKISLEKYASGCIVVHQKFIASLNTLNTQHNYLSILECKINATRRGVGSDSHYRHINAPYDFLGFEKDPIIGVIAPEVIDYVAMKECVDNLSQKDRLLNR